MAKERKKLKIRGRDYEYDKDTSEIFEKKSINIESLQMNIQKLGEQIISLTREKEELEAVVEQLGGE